MREQVFQRKRLAVDAKHGLARVNSKWNAEHAIATRILSGCTVARWNLRMLGCTGGSAFGRSLQRSCYVRRRIAA